MSDQSDEKDIAEEVTVRVEGLGKCYAIYRSPADRLKQMLLPWRRFHTDYWALRDVSFDVPRGQTVGILGRNGAGKSTLLKVITGTVEPTLGKVAVRGRVAALLELGAGFNPEFTGRENVHLAAAVLGLTDRQIAERFDTIADFAGIGDFLEQPVKLYSSGMYARLAFAVAAHVDADILIIDEILSVGDAAFNQKCMRFIEGFKKRGTILFVSHDAGSMARLCDRIVWLDCGTVRQVGQPKEVLEAYMASVYGESDGDRLRIGGRRATPPATVSAPPPPPLASQVQVFDFDPDAPWFGLEGARILNATLTDVDSGNVTMRGGENVVLTITAQVHQPMAQPIIGFLVKDRLGQIIFVDNSFSTHSLLPRMAEPGEILTARFHFTLPHLAEGDYAMSVAIAEGTETAHVQHHWLHDALFFRVTTGRSFRGLVAVPMDQVSLEIGQAEPLRQ
ncbi:ABC transporter ATP-binding protein [Niveispirillum lacus]|uniref:ABC transporter ATP-binding protein n=1 Tax=Niveispirillum lacus TaxID=1981099 RepID=UPI001A9C4D0D|nr:ABC transporter ATP-binding protein [Niveispirillum lacus]